MQNDIKALIWDMGGVILQEKNPEPRMKLADEFHIKLSELYYQVFNGELSNRATVGEILEKELWENLSQSFNIPPEKFTDFFARFWEGDKIDSDVRDYIQKKKGQFQIALLSNAWSDTRYWLDYYDITDLFDEIVISAEVKLAKPDPAIYHEVLRRLSIAPEQAIFVDDREENIAAANQLGMHGVVFKTTQQALEDVEKLLQ
ncbi:MAG: HAD family phosphatase [Anaerolineaceae bacterium]|nr:HAD family phosphatase [Anaerolineaceae bacterium]